jgi:hypothetical protein
MAKVKGTLINAWKNFLKERYGEAQLAGAIQGLDAGDRFYLQSPILDSTWYPMELQRTMGRLTRLMTQPTDKDLSVELGRYTADYVYAKVYRMLLKKPQKDRAIDWFDDVVYQDLRKCVIERSGPTTCIARYYYQEDKPTTGQCRSIKGFIARKLELAGYQNVICTHPKCMAKGDDCCEFLMEWEN